MAKPPWGSLLGNPIEVSRRSTPEGKQAIENMALTEQYQKMLALKNHYGIEGESGWRPWYYLALAVASEFDDGLKIIEAKPKGGATAPKWKEADGAALLVEVDAILKNHRRSESVTWALEQLKRYSPDRYGGLSTKTLQNAYTLAQHHHRNIPKRRRKKQKASG